MRQRGGNCYVRGGTESGSLFRTPRVFITASPTCRTISAQRAYEIGFVNQVVPRAELIPAALAMAADIVECAPLSVVAVRQVVRHTMNMGLDAALEVGKQVCAPLYATEDMKEGALAFKEKRKPQWKGR